MGILRLVAKSFFPPFSSSSSLSPSISTNTNKKSTSNTATTTINTNTNNDSLYEAWIVNAGEISADTCTNLPYLDSSKINKLIYNKNKEEGGSNNTSTFNNNNDNDENDKCNWLPLALAVRNTCHYGAALAIFDATTITTTKITKEDKNK